MIAKEAITKIRPTMAVITWPRADDIDLGSPPAVIKRMAPIIRNMREKAAAAETVIRIRSEIKATRPAGPAPNC